MHIIIYNCIYNAEKQGVRPWFALHPHFLFPFARGSFLRFPRGSVSKDPWTTRLMAFLTFSWPPLFDDQEVSLSIEGSITDANRKYSWFSYPVQLVKLHCCWTEYHYFDPWLLLHIPL